MRLKKTNRSSKIVFAEVRWGKYTYVDPLLSSTAISAL